jgi:hypothetical protein
LGEKDTGDEGIFFNPGEKSEFGDLYPFSDFCASLSEFIIQGKALRPKY